VSDLAFLSPGAALSGVALRTPMEAAHQAAGARIEERDGWRIAVYPEADPPVWVTDLSQLAKFELRGPASANGDGLRLTPTRTLVLGEPPVALGPEAIDVTCVYAAVRVGGPEVPPLFGRISALDIRPRSFPVGAVMLGSIARCPGIVVNEGAGRMLLMVGWEYGAYLWETVLDAGAPLGIRPRTEAP
jgi:glycine cleavage system aminomethyltransferase T